MHELLLILMKNRVLNSIGVTILTTNVFTIPPVISFKMSDSLLVRVSTINEQHHATRASQMTTKMKYKTTSGTIIIHQKLVGVNKCPQQHNYKNAVQDHHHLQL